MNIVERAKSFVEAMLGLKTRDWRRCPRCGSRATQKYGSYTRRPYDDQERTVRRVQRYRCHACRKTYSEQAPDLVPRGWYTRAVRRKAIEMHQHLGCSLRKTAEWLRAEIGKQGRYRIWHILARLAREAVCCHLCERTLERLVDERTVQLQHLARYDGWSTGNRTAAWRVIDSTRLLSITANLGDVRSTITHPATTTHGRLTPEERARAGIGEGLIRVAVGLEAVDDLIADLARGLAGDGD